MGGQPNIEKRSIGSCNQCDKSKRQCIQGLLRKDGARWHDHKQCPSRSSTKDAYRDVGHVENKQSVRRKITLFAVRAEQTNSVGFVEVISMASRSLSRLRVPFSHWIGFLLSPHSVNEPQPLFCYASIICMDCHPGKSLIGGWQRLYDCPQIESDH